MGWIFAAIGWTLAAILAFELEAQKRRDVDTLNKYFEKRIKEIARAR